MSTSSGSDRSGRAVALAIIGLTAVFGIGMWYAQTRAYYEPLDSSAARELSVTLADGSVVPLPVTDFQGIDASSSPLRYRACFTLDAAAATVLEGAEAFADAVPLTGPGWFECYNAAEIGADLESGAAAGYLARANLVEGVDRVLAIYPSGRGFAWHQLNEAFEQ